MKIIPRFATKTERLRIKLFFYVAAAFLALSLALTTAILSILFDHLKKAEDLNIFHAAQTRSMAITEWNRRAKNLAAQITSRTMIREELERFNSGKISLRQLRDFTEPKLIDALNLSEEIVGIVRLNRKGLVVARCGLGTRLSEDAFTAVEPGTREVILSEPKTVGDKRIVIVYAPIKNREGVEQGTDLVLIQLNLLQDILGSFRSLGKTDELLVAYFIEGSLVSVSPINDQRTRTDLVPQSGTVEYFLSKAIEGEEGVVRIAERTVAYTPIAETQWGLAITQNQTELYASLYTKLLLIGAISLSIYLLMLAGFWSVLRPLAGKFLMRAGELEEKIQEKTLSLENEITERKKAEQQKDESIQKLQEALQKINTLQGLLPICSFCKKIRDDKGYWNQIETYLSQHSDMNFSHGLCPCCMEKHYPEYVRSTRRGNEV